MYKSDYVNYQNDCNMVVFKHVPANTIVLDVGCNTGNLGAELIAKKSCRVYGIDYSQAAIAKAQTRLTAAQHFNIEGEVVPYADKQFDVIIFADILEHVQFPNDVLKRFQRLLTPDGILVASIPNVANISIRLRLLTGRWNYTTQGILDRTHLKFFTLKTIKHLFTSSGYEVDALDITPGCKFFILRYFSILKKMQGPLCKIYPRLFAKQFIITAHKRNG